MKLFSADHTTTQSILISNDTIIEENGVKKVVDLEIISRETIKPSSPTPHHLRTFNLSIIDQYMYDIYTPTIWFFANTNDASVNDVVVTERRSKCLKEALSQILTRFYPLAGKIKNSLEIECNDQGVCYSEARVNQTLEDFLGDTINDDRLRVLLPQTPCTAQTSKGNYVLGIQVNIFKCDGIGLSASFSHKIFDGQTIYLFMKSWAAVASSDAPTENIVTPSFIASEIFPNNPSLEYTVPSKILTTKTATTKRFVFDSTSLALLKTQAVANARPPTRMEATVALVWKAAAEAASKVRPFGPHSPHVLVPVVNIRKRASPHLPEESIGNLIDGTGAICFPGGQLDLATMMGEVRESIAKINADHVESMKGEKGHEKINEVLRGYNQLADMTAEGDCMIVSSLLNIGMYEIDFGWGKPIWFYIMNAGVARFLFLTDTMKGGGIEAIVSLSPEEMELFECDSGILSYATVNPSPLRLVH